MKNKSTLLILLLLNITLYSFSQSCGNQIIFDEFNTDGAIPPEWTEFNTNGQVTVENGRLKLDYTASKPSAYRIFTPTQNNTTLSFTEESSRNWVKCRLDILSSDDKYLTSIIFGNDGVGSVQYATSVDDSNTPTTFAGQLIDGAYLKNHEYSFSIYFDFEKSTFNFYDSGILRAEEIPFIESVSDVAKISITQISMYNEEGQFYFDNISLNQDNINRHQLNEVISSANTSIINATIGDSYGQYSNTDVTNFQNAIDLASVVLQNCEATQNEIDQSADNLISSHAAFKNSMINNPVLKIYTGYNFSGDMQDVYCGYYNGTLDEFDNRIISFTLDKGYMATFAQNINGTGISKVYIASEEKLEINLPNELQNSISFIRVSPWKDINKKGIGAKGEDVIEALDCGWHYNWSNNGEILANDAQFVPNQWGGGSLSGAMELGERMDIAHHMAFNEPDNDDQSNMTTDKAIEKYELLLASGLRLGSPANTDGAKGATWRDDFMEKAEAAGYRVDYMVVHYYKKSTPIGFYNWLKNIHDKWHRPIWIKEFNYGAPWVSNKPSTNEAASDGLESYINMLDTCSFVERYAVFTWQPDNAVYSLMSVRTPITLSVSGEMYKSHIAPLAYTQEEYEQGSNLSTKINNNKNLKTEVSIYPNPIKNGKVYINFANYNGEFGVSISDIAGNIIINNKRDQKQIDVSNLPKGLYILSITHGNEKTIRKILIE